LAEATAVRLFGEIGVTVAFRSGNHKRPEANGVPVIQIQLDEKAPADFHPGAMAYATPYAGVGTRIHIICDRVAKRSLDAGSGKVLGHVLAHEISHVLQGVSRHSAEGVMKADWQTADFHKMVEGTLVFESIDIDLIHAGLATPPVAAVVAKK
jgi:hypothetical protein